MNAIKELELKEIFQSVEIVNGILGSQDLGPRNRWIYLCLWVCYALSSINVWVYLWVGLYNNRLVCDHLACHLLTALRQTETPKYHLPPDFIFPFSQPLLNQHIFFNIIITFWIICKQCELNCRYCFWFGKN